VRNFLGKDGVKVSAKCVNYFDTVTQFAFYKKLSFFWTTLEIVPEINFVSN